MEKIRVVLDASPLGAASQDPRARTGIFRVVERLAQGLAASEACRLAFSIDNPVRALLRTEEFLRSHPVLRDVPVVGPPLGRRLMRTVDRRLEQAGGAEARLLSRGIGLYERFVNRPDWVSARATDIFHSTFYPLPGVSRRHSPPRRFLTVYDLIPLRFPQWFESNQAAYMGDVYRSLQPRDWALAISENTKADLCEYCGVAPDRVFVTPLAADPELFHPCSDADRQASVRHKYGIPEAPYLLSLNTLEPRKNMDHAIQAFARLVQQERLDELHFVLVGSLGWKFEKIMDAVAGAGAARDRIILTGYVEDEDLAALYSGALAFVYPSLYEGFGLPPLEAMHCATAVIASNNSSLPEVVGDAGILLDAADSEGLCQAMLDVYRDATLRRQMEERSLARARQFSWDRFLRQTLDAYRTALAA